MPADELKRAQQAQTTTPRGSLQTAASAPPPQRPCTSSSDGWSLASTVEDDTKRSMQAVGQVCRTAVIGVLLSGLGGVAALLGLLLF